MNPTPARSLLAMASAALGLSLGLSNLVAQTAPASASSTTQEAAVKLDPFNVSAESDVGFVAANSLAGGRMTTALKDTPVAYSVLTSEFLEAFNINDASKAAEFSVNSNQYYNDGLQGTSGNTTITIRIRGQNANGPVRNFFPYSLSADTYSVDRVDFARGANASLFGAGASAGSQNTVTKQALTTKTIREVRAQVGSWDRYRLTFDVNQPITDKFAVRANVLLVQGNTWRQREWERRKGIDLAATYNFSPKFSMRAEFEYRTTDRTTGTNRSKDTTSAWDGKFTPSGIDLNMTALQMGVYGVSRASQRFVVDSENLHNVYNIQSMFQTKSAGFSSTSPNYFAGQQIKSSGMTSGFSMTDVWDSPIRFAATQAGSPYFILPAKDFTPLWDKDYRYPSGWDRGKDLAVYFTYRPFEGFFAELSGDRNIVHRWTEYPATGGMYNYFVDINRNKANGQPNPYFLHPYSENSPFSFMKNPGYHNMNLQLAYVKETRFGKLQAGVMSGVQYLDQENREGFFLLPLQNGVLPGADFRSFFSASDQNIQSVYTRQYSDLRGKLPSPHPQEIGYNVFNPLLGTGATLTPHWYVLGNRPGSTDDLSKRYKFIQVPINLNLFKNHLVLIAAMRRDLTRLSDKQFTVADDMPVGWDGSYYSIKPPAPSDYWTLLYTPKDASGKAISAPIGAAARPRQIINGVAVPLAQYAKDRFQDDYSIPAITNAVNTRTVGAVVNLTSWLGIYGNNSTTFDLNSGNTDANLKLIAPTSSHSLDAGIRFNLPNGKLNFSLGWYNAKQKGQAYNVGFSFMGNINNIANSPAVGDLSDGGRNVRGLPVFPGLNVFSTLDSETTGYEAELTANFTRNWRLVVNAGTNKPVQENVVPDLPGWIKDHDAQLRLILADSGVTIDANNHAEINPALNDPAKINVNRVTSAVNAWNSYVTNTIPTIILTNATASQQGGGPVITANIATDYRFSSGWFKGLRAGIALNYRGRQILGARTADTIPNPTNPTAAIADPNNSATNYLWAGGYTKGTANFSYTYRLKESGRRYAPKTVQFDLAIDNLLGLNRAVLDFSSTNNSTANSLVMLPRNNDVSNPSVVSAPGSYNYQPPRNFTLTAKLNF